MTNKSKAALLTVITRSLFCDDCARTIGAQCSGCRVKILCATLDDMRG